MSLKAQLQADMKTALKGGDKERLSVIRMLLAAIQSKEIDERGELDDNAVLAVIEKLVKSKSVVTLAENMYTNFEVGYKQSW